MLIFLNDILCFLFSGLKVNNSKSSNYVIAIITNQSDLIFINLIENKVMRFLNENINIITYENKRRIYEKYINSVSFKTNSLNAKIIFEPFLIGRSFIDLSKDIKILNLKKIIKSFNNLIFENKIINNSEIKNLKLQINKLLDSTVLEQKIKRVLVKINIKDKIENFDFIPSHTDLSSRNLIYYKNDLIVIDFPNMRYFPFFYDPLSIIFLSDNEVLNLFLSDTFEKEFSKILRLDHFSAEVRKLQIANYILFFIILHAYRKVTQKIEDKININDFKKNITLGWEKWYLPYINKNKLKV